VSRGKLVFKLLTALKVLGGTSIMVVQRTGWKPVPPGAAGTEARPTNFFMFYTKLRS
jgi:hypothetical protein